MKKLNAIAAICVIAYVGEHFVTQIYYGVKLAQAQNEAYQMQRNHDLCRALGEAAAIAPQCQ